MVTHGSQRPVELFCVALLVEFFLEYLGEDLFFFLSGGLATWQGRDLESAKKKEDRTRPVHGVDFHRRRRNRKLRALVHRGAGWDVLVLVPMGSQEEAMGLQ